MPVRSDLRRPQHLTSLVTLAEALEALDRRRAVDATLPSCTDPAWSMLMALFAAEARGERFSVSHLCAASGAPLTTAFRVVLRMEDCRMLTRTVDSRDHRRSLVTLSDPTRIALAEALGGLGEALRHQSD